MAQFLLLSVMIGAIAMPVLAARDANGMRGLKKAVLFTLAFNLFYLLAMRFIYPRL